MPPQALAALATLVSFAPHGNRIEFQLDRGAAEMVWVTPSAFRFRRSLDGALPPATTAQRAAIELEVDDQPGLVRVRSKFLDVAILKNGVTLRVLRRDGTLLMADASEPRPTAAGVALERRSPPGARFYGLGPRTEAVLDLGGSAYRTETPFLLCTAGYGEDHAAGASYGFDFTNPERYRVEAPSVDYYFIYGPTLKQIFEERNEVRGTGDPWTVSSERFGSWEGLRAALLHLVHGAMTGMLEPAADLRPYAAAPPDLLQRARQLISLVPTVTPGESGLSGFRRQLGSFFDAYREEMLDKGYPVWHPLPFQFPEDPECAEHADEFMLGDEMLVAPVYEPAGKRTVYLPQGIWTNLETDEIFPGRRRITVTGPALPVFARNGAIIPLDASAGMALHYFPKLAAEFFILEREENAWTQVHAAPAGDEMRLEIESKHGRDYQWVVHHVEKPASVGFGTAKFREVAGTALADRTWSYDAGTKRLQVRVSVAAGEDSIINLLY